MNSFPKLKLGLPGSLRLKVSLWVALSLLVILSLFTWLEYIHLREVLLNQLSHIAAQAGQVIEDNLRQKMLANDFDAIQQTLDAIGSSQGFRSILLLNVKGEVIFAPANRDLGKLLNKNHPGCQSCHMLPSTERYQSIVTTTEDGATVFRSMKPIENEPACTNCHDPKQRLIGLLLIDISTEPLEVSLNEALRTSLLWWSGTVVIMLLVINIVLHYLVLHPLEGFEAAFKLIGIGNPAPALPTNKGDEIGRLAQTFNSMTQQIENRQAENQDLTNRLHKENTIRSELLHRLIGAQEDERKRVARELHDELGQSLSALSLHSDALSRTVDTNPQGARHQSEIIRQIVLQMSDELHDLIMDLRPTILDDLGLIAALRSLAERLFESSSTQLKFNVPEEMVRLPPTIETSIYRTCQEALTNVARHSGATHVGITMLLLQPAEDQHSLQVSITDDGIGFDSDAIQIVGNYMKGFGLLGMRERIAQCGGQLEISASPGNGVTILMTLPLDPMQTFPQDEN